MLNYLVLIGINYQPRRSSGDKNFWVDIIQQVSTRIDRITILSIRQDAKQTESFEINRCKITIHYLRPKFLESPDTKHTGKRLFWNGGAYPRGLGVIEKLLNVRSILRALNQIRDESPYDHIHLMDNLGFANRLIATYVKTSVSVSAMAYQGGKSNFIYNVFLKLSYSHSNLTVVPYSNCYKKMFVKIGLSIERICHIHWGVIPASDTTHQTPATRSGEKPLILWTGYIQQINRDDFMYALQITQLAIQQGIQASFFFAFKPESFESGFEQYHDPEKGIVVKSTTVQEFAELREKISIMFSPVVGRSTILAPPLTWIEMMGNGVPVVTTNVPGADEAVVDGVTGYIANSDESLVNALFKAVENYGNMAESCKDHVKNHYNIENSAKAYLQLWNELSAGKSVNA
ncbi:glycosyltransferase [Trichlorobacter lovleyi]|uniref:glycosyltransferase n=1 Tax=Trichlorobacter lovleyi TaxID=313985 RepID=UPI0024817DF5|nr:glycosyltransferase [Trichlorobacter lovleyi]